MKAVTVRWCNAIKPSLLTIRVRCVADIINIYADKPEPKHTHTHTTIIIINCMVTSCVFFILPPSPFLSLPFSLSHHLLFLFCRSFACDRCFLFTIKKAYLRIYFKFFACFLVFFPSFFVWACACANICYSHGSRVLFRDEKRVHKKQYMHPIWGNFFLFAFRLGL